MVAYGIRPYNIKREEGGIKILICIKKEKEEYIGEKYTKEKICIISVLPSGINTNFQRESGVKNINPSGLLDPDELSKEILTLIKKGESVVMLKGFSTRVFKIMRGLFPAKHYINLVRTLFNKYR